MNYNGNLISDTIEEFHAAIQVAGITPPASIRADGKLHRFSSNGKQGDDAGWYVVHVDGDIVAGCFGDWRTGLKQDWHANTNRELSIAEKAKFKEKMVSIRREREAEEKRRRAEAQTKAAEIWSKADLVAECSHPYLIKKRIKASGIKIYNNSLVIPLYDENHLLHSLQFIDKDGAKRFLTGGRITGCFYTIGNIEKAAVLCIAEGIATSETIHEATGYPVVTAFNAGNLIAVTKIMRNKFPDLPIILCADDDQKTKGNPGLSKAKEAVKAVRGVFVIAPYFDENRPDWASDFNDMMHLEGLDAVRECINQALSFELTPIDLPDSQPSVIPLEPGMLPPSIRDYIFDVADRQQSPPDFVAVAAIIGLSGLLGRKVLICPKQNDDWTVTPNQWGIIIGRPSAMKSPSMKEALKPLRQIEMRMAEQFKENVQQHKEACLLAEITESIAKQKAKKAIQKGEMDEAKKALKGNEEIVSPPTRARLIINDATIEKLGELLNENPNGLILSRDELAGWLAKLTKEEYQEDRAFYLECFDGNGHFVYDRIGRGTIDVKHCTLSVIGGIQPSKIASLVREAIKGTADDGLIQRFQFAVWPDDIGMWEWRDRAPNQRAKDSYYMTFERLHNLRFDTEQGDSNCLRFSYEAQQLFVQWMEDIQIRAREEYTHPAIESHMLKMPQTIAGLALLFEIIDGGYEIVGVEATTRALMWADYLLSHAHRLYSVATNQCIQNARVILKRKDKLPNPFSVRDIHRKNWTGLDNVTVIMEALECLIDYRHVCSKQIPSTTHGGRPTTAYHWVVNLKNILLQKYEDVPDHLVTELT